jgi:RNA polymerase sigma factor (sigma-70 family)
VVNAARDARRPADVPLDEWELASPAATEHREIRQWISELPERQRVAVFLRYFTDLDYRGIAEALDIEVGTVSAALHAAHATLRTRVGTDGRTE